MNGNHVDPSITDDQPAVRLPPATAQRPRVWTVFVAVLIGIVLALIFQITFAVVVAIVEVSFGVEPARLTEAIASRLASPYIFIALLISGPLAFGLAGFVPALLSREPFRERVGWTKAYPAWTVYPLAMLGSLFPLGIGITLAEALARVIPPDETAEAFFEAVTIDAAIVFVVLVGVVPGICEELLFRGYMQQRLVRRWGNAIGITITSILFGLVHVMPHAVAAAVPLGFWFGYIAWRSKSILPAVGCHFFVNSGLNAWRMIVKFGEVSDFMQSVVQIGLFIVGVVCFAVCCWPRYWRRRSPSTAAD
jgi:membrane protease YdiL (CAAX protease family)